MSKPKIIAIVGPTGSGKTRLGQRVVKLYNGVIISADSRQVYEGLDVGTNKEGKPGEWRGLNARYLENIPQLLIDVAKPGARFTLADWLRLSKLAINKVVEEGFLPVVVGGTGLYVTALLDNWQPPEENPNIRPDLEALSLEELQKMSEQYPISKSDRFNKRRLVRVVERGGNQVVSIDSPYVSLILEVEKSREELFRKADERYLDNWPLLLEEIAHLQKQGVELEWLKSLGMDYRVACEYLDGQMTKDEAFRRYGAAVRSLIRRQQTWQRHHGEVIKIQTFEQAQQAIEQFLNQA